MGGGVETRSLCSIRHLGTHTVDQTDLEFAEIHLPLSPERLKC